MSAQTERATGSLAEQVAPQGGPSSREGFSEAVDGTEVAADASSIAIDDKGSGIAPEPGDPSRLADIKTEMAMTPGRNRMYELGM